MENIEIRPISMENLDEVKAHIIESLAPREPLSMTLNVSPAEFWELFGNLVEACLKSGTSLGAYCKDTNELCGLATNIPGNADLKDPRENEKLPLCAKQLYTVLQQTYPNGMASEIGTKNYLEIFFLGVKQGFGQRGIGAQILKRSMEVGKQNGFSFMTIDCTSAYSAKAAENVGFKVVREVVYEDYVDPITGKEVMKGASKPHRASTLLAIKIA